ncbi:extracellular solute-binding protein [Natronosporangium hydrolyticum]|uniref:Extracellular solute-binding protein n=1 Tax=Natronosporangium hydrolyticum TaxID=2811111 RepID=A0A895YMT0_9ACTN|nr:extracellular solute-binding protein [Natronosporangium hydrolyticum]QSB16613.1 extracellular solute-binding protein [Natronosporangium hydrolyticum]
MLVQRTVGAPSAASGDSPGDEPAGGGHAGDEQRGSAAPIRLFVEEPSGGVDEPWRELAEGFTVASGDEVAIEEVYFSDYRYELGERLRADDPPDVYRNSGGNRLRRQVEAGLVRDLTDDLADVIATLSPSALAPYTVDGRVYGLPYHTELFGVWYNKALFADAGLDPARPPQTWGDFSAAVSALKAADIAPVAVSEWTMHHWYGYLITRVAGSDALAAAGTTRSLTDNPDILRATELFEEFLRSEPFQPGFEFGEDEALMTTDLIGAAEAAMELGYQGAHVGYELFSAGDDLGDDLGWFPFPTVERGVGTAADTYGGGDGVVVGANAPDATFDLLRYMFSDGFYSRLLPPLGLSVRAEAVPSDLSPFEARHLEVVQAAPGRQLTLEADLPAEVMYELRRELRQLYDAESTAEGLVARVTAGWQAADDFD